MTHLDRRPVRRRPLAPPSPASANGSLSTKAQILRAARVVLQRDGVGNLTIRSVATEADVNLALIHYHFHSRDGLLLAVLEDLNVDLLARQRGMYDRADMTLADKWRQAVAFYHQDLESGFVRTLLERFRARLNVELVNIYGPTETTVEAAYWVAEQQVTTDVVPIGRPMANAQLYVLDTHLQPVPIGVPGELYIGGAGLARGYLGRPELTAERFVPNPFSVEVGARLYKTGDLVRYLPDGNVEYLGRLDHQVKLRGVRIELGEIEATLREHPEVRDAAVVAREDPPGDKRLVAYVVSLAGTAPTREALRRFLQAKLPASMVPSAFVLLPALPLTSSGKVDRRSLPAPDPTRPDGDYVAPRDMLERQLAQLWEDLLGVHPVGAADNFFELGGHSLLAGRLLARVRERFHVDVSLRTFFTAPTVADLATAIVQKLAEGADAASMTRMLDELWNLSDEDAGRLLGDMGT